ncbi:MAG TPA: sarcosine oxidase subunit gamma family protein [Patescibacteria group bacterium]|nr:sarcosine oxidase subunit gamma family protein [Patescibacteria group bacterium]
MDDRRRSPLADVRLPDGLHELPFQTQLDLRLDPADAAARAAVESIIGPLPVEPNTVAGGPVGAVLWLGPDEWLIVARDGAAPGLEARIRSAAAGSFVAIIDVSANRTILELSCADARAILAGGCSIDLHPRAFGPGRCAQTLIARAGVILWQTAADPAPTFRLLVRPSFAAYLAAWLTDAIPG